MRCNPIGPVAILAAVVTVLTAGPALANSITVEVRTKSGGPSQYSRVNAQACGFGGGQFRKTSTDSSGRVVLNINDNSNVCTIYVDGKDHDGSFSAGGTYSFTTSK